ncbi:MAG: TRAP transporter substrate-binding protein DctP, partial [Pseudomonadota bacterium]
MSLAVLGALGTARAQAETFRVAAYLPAHSKSVGSVMIPWLDRIEAAGGGAVRFERYWGGSLGRGPQRQVLLLEAGVSEIAFLWPGMTRGRFPELELLETPMFVETAREGAVLAWRLYEEGLLSGFDGLQVLGFYTVAPARLFTVVPPPSVTGLAPMKIRTVGPVQANFVRALGGLPETLDAAAVSDALRRGTVDGLIQGWTGLQTFRQYREVGYVVDMPAGVLTFAIAMDRERWLALDEPVRALFLAESGRSLAEFAGQVFDREA